MPLDMITKKNIRRIKKNVWVSVKSHFLKITHFFTETIAKLETGDHSLSCLIAEFKELLFCHTIMKKFLENCESKKVTGRYSNTCSYSNTRK